MKTLKIRAFTLIELLVVIAIIALLTAIIVTSLTGSRAKARDAKRISDLGQIQLAIELYFDRCHQYPLSLSTSANNCSVTATPAITLGTYISQIPTPPSGAAGSPAAYDYVVNSPHSTVPTDYILHTTLEGSNDVQKNSFQGPSQQAFLNNNGYPSTSNGTTPNTITWGCYWPTNSDPNYTYPLEYCLGAK
jgi:prepilin-type N-terminal cleavage/methylation domain-containing protein